MRVLPLLCFALLACCATAALAAPRRIILGPPASEVGFRAYGLGLLPIDARFPRFTGSLTYDPDDHAVCRVDLSIDVASLVADDPSMRDTMLGPGFMDAAHFPSLIYTGTCQGQGLVGMLGMHGITRPFRTVADLEPREGRSRGPAAPSGLGHDRDAHSGGTYGPDPRGGSTAGCNTRRRELIFRQRGGQFLLLRL